MSADRRSFLAGCLGVVAAPGTAQVSTQRALSFPSTESFPLWPGQPPGAPSSPIQPNWSRNGELWVRGVPAPEVHVFRPRLANGAGLLIVPGGGYEFLSVENEGTRPAARFNREGTTVFLLLYRLPVDGWLSPALAPLQDAQRAMRLIRSRAADFSIRPDQLGVLGFSAGGHLAADLTVAHAEHSYPPLEAADRLSARPAFTGLLYPVVSLEPGMTHGSSRRNLLGARPSQKLVIARSPVRHVTGKTPPSFVAHAFDDGTVPIQNSLEWIAACRRARAPVEAHLFETGGHGFGLGLPTDNPGSRWPELFALWMRRQIG